MDPPENPAPRKRRFAPKRQNRRTPKSTPVPKLDDEDDVDNEAQELLLKRFNESRGRQRPKDENKSSVQPTFIHNAKQSTTSRSYDSPEYGSLKQSYGLDLMEVDNAKLPCTSSSSAVGPSLKSKAPAHDLGPKKEYKEPWDFQTDYPTTLPWRKPNSGNPDILDEAEFGEAARKVEYDETKINHASELGFLNPDETNDNPRLLFIELPHRLPVIRRTATAKGKEVDLASEGSIALAGPSCRKPTLEELSAGWMGKLLVYKSGAVKLKLGETLFDVSPGSDCSFAQEVTAVNTKIKEFCEIRPLDKRVVITPDVEYLLNSANDIGSGGKAPFNQRI